MRHVWTGLCLVALALAGCGGSSGPGQTPSTMTATVNGAPFVAAAVSRDGSVITGTGAGITISLALPELAEGTYRTRPTDTAAITHSSRFYRVVLLP